MLLRRLTKQRLLAQVSPSGNFELGFFLDCPGRRIKKNRCVTEHRSPNVCKLSLCYVYIRVDFPVIKSVHHLVLSYRSTVVSSYFGHYGTKWPKRDLLDVGEAWWNLNKAKWFKFATAVILTLPQGNTWRSIGSKNVGLLDQQGGELFNAMKGGYQRPKAETTCKKARSAEHGSSVIFKSTMGSAPCKMT